MNSNKSKSQSRSHDVELLTFACNWNLDRIVIVKWHRQRFVKTQRRSHTVTRILGARKTHSDIPKNCTDVQNFLYFFTFFKSFINITFHHMQICSMEFFHQQEIVSISLQMSNVEWFYRAHFSLRSYEVSETVPLYFTASSDISCWMRKDKKQWRLRSEMLFWSLYHFTSLC